MCLAEDSLLIFSQPACHRHDFGYHNYRDQSRFTVSGKLNIDNNFKDE